MRRACNRVWVSLSVILFISCGPRSSDCSSVHTGDFYFKSPFNSNVLIIRRNDSIQTEYDVNAQKLVVKKIKWHDECEYELTVLKDERKADTIRYKGKEVREYRATVQRIRITKVTPKYYLYEGVVMDAESYKDTVWIGKLTGGFRPINEIFPTEK